MFLYNILEKVSAKDMWECLRSNGEVVDIILPMKRDKKNKRYGFVKTTSELEAGKIILNAKEKGWIAARIRMSINEMDNRDPGKKYAGNIDSFRPIHKVDRNTENRSFKKAKKIPSIDSQNNKEDQGLGTKMFEFIEANLVDEKIRQRLYDTMIGFSWLEETSGKLQEKMKAVGIEKIKLVGLNEKKFILICEREENWDGFDISTLNCWFSKVKKFGDDDLVVPRTVWLECQGIPMTAWLEENLKGYTHHLGEWISWSYQTDDGCDFFNPLICLSTTNYEHIIK